VFTIQNSDTLKAYAFLLITTALWGSLYVVGKYVMDFVPPLTVLLLRYAVSAAILLPLLKIRRARSGSCVRIEPKDRKYIVLIGAVGYCGATAAQTIGTQLASAGIASLLNSLSPVFMILFAVPVLKEKITVSKAVPIAAAIVGVYVIMGGNDGGDMTAGAVASLISVVIWSFTCVALKQFIQKYDPLTITAYALAVALVCTVPFSAYEVLTIPGIDLLRPDVLLGLLYMGAACTALTNVLWNASLSLIEAGRCALFYPVQPLVASLMGAIFLQEELQMSFLIGSALIVGGVVFSVLSSMPSRTEVAVSA
jgi:drug/metabolite transporter (DMT)-like permease